MAATSSTAAPVELERPLHALAAPVAPRARRRVALSTALGVFAVAFVAGMFGVFGVEALAVSLPALGVGLLLLWESSDVLRSDECAGAPPAAAAP